MTSTSTTKPAAHSEVEFELAYTLRCMEDVIQEFRTSVSTKFDQNGVLTPEDDEPFMDRILATLLTFRTELSPESMAVLTSPEVNEAVEQTMEEAERALAVEGALDDFIGSLLEALGIDPDDFQSLVASFQDGLLDARSSR